MNSNLSLWVKSIRYRMYHHVLVFVCFAVLGFLFALVSPALSSVPHPESTTVEVDPSSDAQSLLRQGIEYYQAEQFLDAATAWEQALSAFSAQGDRLNQALASSNLSLAYQQLGRWREAEEAIQNAIALLDATTPSSIQSQDTPQLEILAKALNAQGRLAWVQGHLENALDLWQQATLTYQQAGDQPGTMLSLINQANALQALGFNAQAEEQLAQVYQILQQQSEPQLKASGLRSLGNALRRVGKLNESRLILQESLDVIESFTLVADRSLTLLDLGNTERTLGDKAIAIGNVNEATTHHNAALAFYQQAAIATSSPTLKLQAQLNQLSLLVSMERWSDATSVANALEPALDNLPAGRSAVYAQLNFAKSLMRLEANGATHGRVAQRLATAIAQSQRLNDPIAESYAVGQLGELYLSSGQWIEAQRLTEQALFRAESVQAADVRYRWEWQLGRILKQQWESGGTRSRNLREDAIAAYTASIESLKSIRNDLLLISSDIQFSFRDDVEPVYRELVELLLSTEDGATPSQANLRQAIQQVDALQLAELKNFLGCDIAQTVELETVEVDPTAAKLYPMILPNRLAVVLELPGQNQSLAYHELPKPRHEVEATLQQLRQDLSEPDRTPEAIAGLQDVYQWLIAPFNPVLANNNQISTLVFVPDGQLRNIPMAALYNGQQYLIAQYAVALAPRLELFNPTPRPDKLNVFLGGVGESQTINNRTFSSIENLVPELNAIEQLLDAKPPLLNGEFTETNLEQQLKAGRYSAIHLKTHGVFSSDPEETFIVAYQELITSRDLGRLIQAGRAEDATPIEILVLSACSTAQGDNRAVLGLAGVAVQAGARSVVSTLWQAQDVPNTELMIQFYQELTNPTETKAQALRNAQLHLINQGYRTPHIWATYVLVGNWL